MWLIYGLLSAAMAALVGIFGKIGLQSVDANTATAVRAVIMALFLLGVVFFQGSMDRDNPNPVDMTGYFPTVLRLLRY
ncbi:EamA family transporter [Sporomusa aerivorans]